VARLVAPRHSGPVGSGLPGGDPTTGEHGPKKGSPAHLIPLTAREVRRLLLALTEPRDRFRFRLAWSAFRRRHQATAGLCHAARRARASPIPAGQPTVQTLPVAPLALTDECWARVSPLVPPQKPRVGRPAHDHRTILAAILWVVQTGAAWRDLPAHFGSWETASSHYQCWRRAGGRQARPRGSRTHRRPPLGSTHTRTEVSLS
jgi:transposase